MANAKCLAHMFHIYYLGQVSTINYLRMEQFCNKYDCKDTQYLCVLLSIVVINSSYYNTNQLLIIIYKCNCDILMLKFIKYLLVNRPFDFGHENMSYIW